MTPEYVRSLPFLLTRSLVMQVTGLSARGVRSAVDAGSLRVYRDGEGRQRRYYRLDVERLIGLEEGKHGSTRSIACGVGGSRSTFGREG